MKKVIALFSALFLSSVLFAHSAYACDNQGKHGEKMMHRISSHLDLNEQQQQQLEAIFAEKKPQMQAIHEQMQDLRTETNSAINEILNDEQKEKFQAHLAKREKHRQHFSKHHL